MNYEKELKVAETAARKAGKILMNMFGKNISSQKKIGRDFVTDADMAAEKIIINEIKKNFPTHSIISEEAGEIGESEYRWIIDPLDGTHNFYYGIPLFGVMISLEQMDDIVAAAVYLPYTNEMYTAVRGKGAFFNGKKIHVSERKNKFMYAYSGIYDYYKNEASRKLFDRTARKFSPHERILVSVAFTWCLMARGAVDGTIRRNIKIWDMASGILLVEEAGGRVTDIYGKRWNIKTKDFIVSNGPMHKELLKIMMKLEKGRK